MHSGDDIGAIVADIGTYSTRVGFAGDDVPRAMVQTVVGVAADGNEKQYHLDINKHNTNLEVVSPVEDAVVSDWNAIEKLWEYSIANFLRVDVKECPVMMSEKPYNSPSSRHRLTELMFETFATPAFFLTKDAVLSCYACGKTSGLVIDAGASGTVITPVQDGWVDVKGVNRSAIGGRLLDSHVSSVLKRICPNGLKPAFRLNKTVTDWGVQVADNLSLGPIHSTYESLMNLELGRDFKESICRVADSTVIDTDPRFTNLPLLPYELPDGTMIDVGIERFLIPELYFDPSSINFDHPDLLALQSPTHQRIGASRDSLPALVRDSILRCDIETQVMLLSNMVVTGGSSSFEGLNERIRNEVEKVIHQSAPGWRIKSTATAVSERSICTWLGGSILASLGAFHDMWVSKAEYDEVGCAIIDKKCP